VSLLPYPPFRLRRSAGRGVLFVDGAFIVVRVLAEWNFEILGEMLTEEEIDRLDAYTRRCKLGTFRLRHALNLSRSTAPAAGRELETLRAQARRKFQRLMLIKNTRVRNMSRPT